MKNDFLNAISKMSFDGGWGDRLIIMYVVDVLGDFVLGFCPPVTLLTIYIFFY